MAKSSKHQSKLLVLAKGEFASFLVEWCCERYTQAQGTLGYFGVKRFEGGDGGPLAKAVDVFLEGDAFAQTDGRGCCHNHDKNLQSRCMQKS